MPHQSSLTMLVVLMFITLLQPASSLITAKGTAGSDDAKNFNPIRKVLGMLSDMKTELENEVHSEKDLFEKAMCACETGEAELNKVIDHSTSEISRLTASLEGETAEKSKLDTEIKKHTDDKVATESALEQAKAIRAKEHEKFVAREKMLKFSIGQLDETIPLIEGSASAAAFLQSSKTVPYIRRIVSVTQYLNDEQKDTVLSYLQGGETEQAPSAGSQQIIGILKVMHDEMTADLKGMTKEEADSAAAFSELKESKLKELGILIKTLSEKGKRVGELALSISQDTDAKDDATTELGDATRYLGSLKEQCTQKAKDRDMRAKTRNDEITAISEAMQILSGDEAMHTMGKALRPAAALAQEKSTANYGALLQASGLTRKMSTLVQGKVIEKAQHKHTQHKQAHHKTSTRPAGGVAENANQAAKVVGFMIDNMVKVLHDDDVNDEHKKDWCGNETTSFTQLKADKEMHHEELEKRIEVLTDEITQLKADIKALEEQINSIDQDTLQATVQRKKEHDEFTLEYGQMDTARQLIDKAANRLHAFYNPQHAKTLEKSLTQTAYFTGGSAESAPGAGAVLEEVPQAAEAGDEPNFGAASLVQQHAVHAHRQSKQSAAVAPPEMVDTPTTYVKQESGGVIGLLSKMKEELSVDMRQAETEEKNAMKDYGRVMKDAQTSRASAVKALQDTKARLASTEAKLVQTKKENELTIEEIYQIKIYLQHLDVECSFLMRNFEARHEARVEEEVGLESAETIVTKGEPPSHLETEKAYKEEHSAKDVDEHFPEQPMPVL